LREAVDLWEDAGVLKVLVIVPLTCLLEPILDLRRGLVRGEGLGGVGDGVGGCSGGGDSLVQVGLVDGVEGVGRLMV
jgi:hypothetical protein